MANATPGFESCLTPAGDIYMVTASGKQFCLTNPDPKDVDIQDIAHHLARISRFNGATHGPIPLSVAEHSITVMLHTEKQDREGNLNNGPVFQQMALLHDAHEAYIGDITTPVSKVLGLMAYAGPNEPAAEPLGALLILKAQVQRAIHKALGLPWPVPLEWDDLIRAADRAALLDERTLWITRPYSGWDTPMSHTMAERAFLAQWNGWNA